MGSREQNRRLILARRARFVAAALCGLGGVGCREPGAVAPAPVSGTSEPRAATGWGARTGSTESGPGGGPPGLLDGGPFGASDAGVRDALDGGTPSASEDGGAPLAGAVPPAPTVVVRVCLSIRVLPKVVFAWGSAKPTADSRATLEEAVNVLRDHPTICVEIEGHTDNTEPATVAAARAEAVQRELVAHGIDQARLSTTSAGASKPIAPNSTGENRARNRRVDLRVRDCPGAVTPSSGTGGAALLPR
jgi:outer membrane protein OmpA-like peptidoglycan-associated protein